MAAVLRRIALGAHDKAIEAVFWPAMTTRLSFVSTAAFYAAGGLNWFNDTHLARDSRTALGAWLAAAHPLTGSVLWVGDSWGLGTGTAYGEAAGVEVVNRSKAGRRLVDMLSTLARAPRTDHVVLQFGVNDMTRGRDPLPDVGRAARLARAPLVVIGIPPIRGHEAEAANINARLAHAGTYGT